MADYIELASSSGGDKVAADEIASVKHQRVKVQHGPDGSATDTSAAAPLPVDANFARQVALGNLSGYALHKAHGSATLTSGPVVLENGTIAFPTAARTHQIASTSANDTNSAGTGARTVVIEGLDTDHDQVTETVNLNGTTEVATSNTYLRINRMYVATAGSGGVNAGTITATADTDETVTAQIVIGYSDTLATTTRYTVPSGKTALLWGWWGSAFLTAGDIDGRADFWLRVRESGAAWRDVLWQRCAVYGAASFDRRFEAPLAIPAEADIYLRGDDVDAGVVAVGSAGYELLLVDD